MDEAWPVKTYAALGWKRANFFRGIQIPGHPGYPMLAYYVGLLRYLQRSGWTETMSLGDASITFASFKIADRVPWFTMQRDGADGDHAFVSSFPIRSVFSKDRGCVLFEKQSLYGCLIDQAKSDGHNSIVHSFFPRTFVYDPSDPMALSDFSRVYDDVVTSGSSAATTKWLIKPGRDAFGGSGIHIVDGRDGVTERLKSDAPQMPKGCLLVAQKLLDNVFTIDGRRFDVRVYVYMTSLNPVVAFWSPYSMIVRLAGKTAHTERHKYLTNFSLHHDKGGLWTVNDMINYLAQRDASDDPDGDYDHKPGSLRQAFDDVTLPGITKALGTVLSLPQRFVHRKNSFQLLGCDFMLDSRDLRPWFIECNGRPLWFGVANPEKFQEVHARMAEDIFRKAAMPGCETENDVFVRIPSPPAASAPAEPVEATPVRSLADDPELAGSAFAAATR